MERSKKIIRTSFVGIGVNLILVIFKAAVGLISGSVAVIMDAVNNLSDALSSVITIIGTKISGRKPDKKHPYGHGRVEYITSALISIIVLATGIISLKESIEKIITPEKATYGVVSIVIIVAAIAAKLAVGIYVRSVGKKLSSGALEASGSDALFDAVLSGGTLIAALISVIWGITLEGWFGAIISLFIIKAGIEMLGKTVSSIIGKRADPELTEKLKEALCAYDEVRGCYDLALHNYGPERIIGSAHVEVQDDMTAKEIHKLTRRIATDIYMKFGIVLTIGIYASHEDELTAGMKNDLDAIVSEYPGILQVHGFYVDEEQMTVTFDLVIDFKADAQSICDEVVAKMKQKHGDYTFFAVLDSDYSD
ncbi:MAG: cation transporter [Clostridia bacterium]|nr:cation transporter [Clostridia bacterium]